ncbi:ArfGap-domain-containing protein [Polychaeton citri CBS 116435]|uniref:ADP-ribosylation factor GTPase-activating protein n=1 Tax=Polychaeton citri CBS 116435 TaxID=1314669 RepID=A0A9P4UU77_9PEZI|nr:ArfGap-domain-containing protein [Polychaeton citri CBS 116435]
MGNVTSSPAGEGLYVRDQSRFSITGITATNSRNQVLLRVSPDQYPATRYIPHKDSTDDGPVEYVQDPETASGNGPPNFLVRLSNADELYITFTFAVRQLQTQNNAAANGAPAASTAVDTALSGLTYIFAATPKEVENLVVREFFADPNLHKNPNVQLVGDYNTSGAASAQFNWTWKWRPPRLTEDRGGGWRNTCSFVEYDQRAHRLNTLASFSFWVQNTSRFLIPRSPRLEVTMPPKLRVPSSQSIESRVSNVSDSEGEGSYRDHKEAQSPSFDPIPENGLGLIPTMTNISAAPGGNAAVKVDVATCRPGEDPVMNDDGPLFRATMRSLEQKTGNMRLRMKRVLRTAEAASLAQRSCNDAVTDFTNALREAASSNANAVRPALDNYFDCIAKEILTYEQQNSFNLQKLIIEPISKLYNIEIKAADFKKREFDEESKEYYAYVSKYLGQRSESLKEKKQKQSDEKYQAKRRTFELKRFDYSTFMHDLHGGRKDQEVLSQLTKYADAQARGYLNTAKKVEDLLPQLDALVAEVKAAERDYQLQRTEREEKRRQLEKTAKVDDTTAPSNGLRSGDGDQTRSVSGASASMASALSSSPPPSSGLAVQTPSTGLLSTPVSASNATTPSPNSKFKGIRDLDDSSNGSMNGGAFRKEGLLWALSRPGSHVDPKGLNKQAWHKFWIVLDQGKLSEYVNWKEKLDLHIDPIDLRMASVREARNSDRRFCFEVITPQFTRVYQAPSEDDMKSWIGSINNALQSAFETRTLSSMPTSPSPASGSSTRKDIAAVLTGKSSSFSGHRHTSSSSRTAANSAVHRNATTGDRPSYRRNESDEAPSSALLNRVREADEGNKVCADCGSDKKVDWCSINLGVMLCIECSGIHRSLGTHISKVRSLTLDTSVFTPDIIEVLLLIGNRVSNMVWEAKLDRFLKPAPHSTREQRLHFITNKYSDRTYVQETFSTQSPDDFLLTSIKRNDLRSVLHALALRANPNAHDRMRSTHALYLALAAADPASPGSGMETSFSHTHSSRSSLGGRAPPIPGNTSGLPTTSASISTPAPPSTSPPRKPFAVAELLLQNGAEIPTESAPIPLSQQAKSYLEVKTDQRIGKPLVAQQPHSAGAPYSSYGAITGGISARDPVNGDGVSALPQIKRASLTPQIPSSQAKR